MRQTISTLFILSLFACSNPSRTDSEENKFSVSADSLTSQANKTVQPETKAQINSQVALEFINSYVDNANKLGQGLGIVEWTKSSQLTTDTFKNELVNMVNKALEEQPGYGLGFDPILDAQDNPNEFVITEFDDQTGIVKLRGKQWENFTLNIKLRVEDGKTLVDGCGVVNLTEEERAKRDW